MFLRSETHPLFLVVHSVWIYENIEFCKVNLSLFNLLSNSYIGDFANTINEF